MRQVSDKEFANKYFPWICCGKKCDKTHITATQTLQALWPQHNKKPCPLNALRQLTASGKPPPPNVCRTECWDITQAGSHFVLLQSHRKTPLFCHNVPPGGKRWVHISSSAAHCLQKIYTYETQCKTACTCKFPYTKLCHSHHRRKWWKEVAVAW